MGTGDVAAAWIGMRVAGIANAQYMYEHLRCMCHKWLEFTKNRTQIIFVIFYGSVFVCVFPA